MLKFTDMELTAIGALLPVFVIGALVSLALTITGKRPVIRWEVAAIAAASAASFVLLLAAAMIWNLTQGAANLLLGVGAAATVALVGAVTARRLFNGVTLPELDQPEVAVEVSPTATAAPSNRPAQTPLTPNASPGRDPLVPTTHPAPGIWRLETIPTSAVWPQDSRHEREQEPTAKPPEAPDLLETDAEKTVRAERERPPDVTLKVVKLGDLLK